MSDKDMAILAVGGAVGLLILYVAWNETADRNQPRYEEASTAVNPNLGDTIDNLDTGPDHYFHPAYCHPGQDQIFTAHRYPRDSGGNISILIHRGMDAMRLRAPQDDDWRVSPPSGEAWL